MRRFYAPAENITGGKVTLTLEETRHLRDVLRLREDDEASVFDGEGREYLCSISRISKNESILEIVREIPPAAPESPLELTLAAAILPGEKFDLVVQKAVELGIVSLRPLFTKRCEARPESSNRRVERWRKIALEAAKQSGRAKLMTVGEPCQFDALIAETDQPEISRILFSERDGTGFSGIREAKRLMAVIGPKGGWDDSELDLATGSGCTIVTFGGRILRAETAAIALSAILQHRFGDLT